MISNKKNLVHTIAKESTLYLPSELLKLNLGIIKKKKKEKNKNYEFFLSNWMKGEIGLRYLQRRQESSIPFNYYGNVTI